MKKRLLARFISNIFVQFMFLLAVTLVTVQAGQVAAHEKIGSEAEWYPAKTISMHTPGDEIFLGVVHPAAT